MKYMALTVEENTLDLGLPISVEINRSADAPADDLEVKFAVESPLEELKAIEVYDEQRLVFDGIVDAQEVIQNSSGTFLNIIARDRTAYLLDNEACPQIYYTPSLLTIFDRHVRPYGFSGYKGNDKSFSTEFVVSKGTSEWEVLENFCCDYLKIYPRVTVDGIIDVTGSKSGEKITFSNFKNGIKFSSIDQISRRYKLYSQVYVKASDDGYYSLKVEDEDAIKRGVVRKRYLNSYDNVKNPASCAEAMLNSARKNSYEIKLICPEKVTVEIGDSADIIDNVAGDFLNLTVVKVKYVLRPSGETTEITMQRSEV